MHSSGVGHAEKSSGSEPSSFAQQPFEQHGMTLLSLTNEPMTLSLSTLFEKRTPLLEGSEVRCLRFKKRYGARTAWPGLVVLVPCEGLVSCKGMVMIERRRTRFGGCEGGWR